MTDSDQSRLDSSSGDRRRAASVRTDGAFSRSYPAAPESVTCVRAALVGYATEIGAAMSVVEGVRLAVSEAASNVVVHAYRAGGEPGLIHVEASVGHGELRISVADTGSGLRVRDDSPGLGLGLAIIGELADCVELLQGGNGGLRVLMHFALAAATSTS